MAPHGFAMDGEVVHRQDERPPLEELSFLEQRSVDLLVESGAARGVSRPAAPMRAFS
jgi:hypothetical protein